MTITRDQLELAARAAGIELYESATLGLCAKLKAGRLAYDIVPWQPHEDHGQLLDLAMACKICIDPRGNKITYLSDGDSYISANVVRVNCQDFPALAETVIQAAVVKQLTKENRE